MKFKKFSLLCVGIVALLIFSCKDKKSQSVQTGAESSKSGALSGAPTELSDPAGEEGMRDAAFDGNYEIIKTLISQNINVNATDMNGQTALMLAAYNGHTAIIQLLIEKGAEVNILDHSGRTALIYASTGPNGKTVEQLLQHKADPNIIDKEEHYTALMYAAAEGELEVVKILLSNNADPYLKDIDGDDAETFARQNNHFKVAEYIRSIKK